MFRSKKPSESLAIDQIAAFTDSDIIRRRFDADNTRAMAAFSLGALLLAFAHLAIAETVRTFGRLLPFAIAQIAFSLPAAAAFGELAYAQRQRGRWKPRLPLDLLARNLTPWAVGFLVVEYGFLVFFQSASNSRSSGAWFAWAFLIPWLMLRIRLELSRRLALHVSFAVIIAISLLLSGKVKRVSLPILAAAVVMNLGALLVGALGGRRLRSQTLEEWADRRVQAREQLRMRNELEYAREVQLSMLPETAPLVDWLDLAGVSIPATEVGGDYFDYFVDADAVAIVCGDVAGHGLASGIVLASLRAGFTLLRASLHDPAAVLQRLSTMIAQTSRRRMFATAAVVRLERASGRAIIASAAHPPLIVRSSGLVEAVELFAPPLGVRLPHRIPSREMAFRSGDVFVLHSDGVYESQSPSGESYGLERLVSVVESAGGADAAAIREAILRDVETFRAGGAQQDDVTVVVARVR
jgi:hypothetical protein